MARLGERALKGAELEALMEDTAAFVAASEGFGRSCVWEFDEEQWHADAAGERRDRPQSKGASISVGRDSPAGLALASGEPVTVADWSQRDPIRRPRPICVTSRSSSTIAVPIDGEKQTLGVIEAHSDATDAFSTQDVYFARSAANVLAHAIERKVAVDEGMLHDHVTGLPNRLLFVDRAEHALDAARGRETPLAVFFLDLDRFKAINDSFGHEVGDEVLKAVVPRLRKQLRSVDTVARFGGDEFAILVEEVVDEAEATRIAERICSAFEVPFMVEGIEQHLTVERRHRGLRRRDPWTASP